MNILKFNQFPSMGQQQDLTIGTVTLILSLGFIQAIRC